ncbi:bifunctional acetaldehyde-CoA/alcohol dehydrogenase [Flavobacterium adhaerens]|uniref:bifunctional acetaldehyde-CoA/alcohol dehydrogenase n=1 Tax=Flavobacterium adhaerens TaxID=3149043 RepID=UPI0032B46825
MEKLKSVAESVLQQTEAIKSDIKVVGAVPGNSVEAVNHVNQLAKKAEVALQKFLLLDQEQVDRIVAKASVAAIDKHGELALHAVQETGRGIFEDKAIKNMFAAENVTNRLKNVKTVGVIGEDPISGIVEIAEPVGVICGVTPTTNPTSTTVFKAIISLKTRNPIIFGFHPSAQQCSKAAAIVVRDAAIAAGAPEDCIQWIEYPSIEATNALMNHPIVSTILATGGNAMVKAAYSCGKPALGVGAGNVPAYIEKTADIKQAVNDIVLSKSFDWGMICASEQAAIIDSEIYNETIEEFKRLHVYFVNKKEKKQLEEFIFGSCANGLNCSGAKLNSAVVGKSPQWIAEQAGFSVPKDIVIIAAEVAEVGVNEPLTREKLSPVLAILKSVSTAEGIKLSEQMVEFDGLGHSAAIHTKDQNIAKEFGVKVKAIRVIWNSPTTFGGIGDVYNSFLPSLTLGCGSYGRNSVSGNVGALNLINIKRIGRRNNNMQWFKVPSKIYFEPNSILYLKSIPDLNKVMIVTDLSMLKLGFVQKIIDVLNMRHNKVDVRIFSSVEPDPSIETAKAGAETMREFKPDTIIALGGGSPMDAAKVMWLMYEQPEVAFEDVRQKFLDIRKRAVKIPNLGALAKLICIPTTSGTGSEVTPFAVISDHKKNIKYPLADYAFTPTVAIIDSELTKTVPPFITADTGMDVLTHATEAFVSIVASDYTDGLALQAIKMVFKYLERAYKDGHNDDEARDKIHNASTMAGMAFANAFLGISHSMAHKIGGVFHTVHGRTNAILLPYVIRYNGEVPGKLSVWPKYTNYRADERYFEICQALGLPSKGPKDAPTVYAQACYDLAVKVGIKMSFKEQGVDEKQWLENINTIAMNAFEDQCTPANPRLPLVADMEEILRKAYYGEV